ncbi:hypothetical protein PsYK624_052590 [Phanerochaete sordida]|uniref:Extracellular membrane protein CFEM domain-containing protein n=1 Tax=Phanerochaete sordida TaxID=48140 RepID=A0A9P3G860_9APHY|nr:hypothetical protein PsYK624_052590 [Phanerochaete sordida]
MVSPRNTWISVFSVFSLILAANAAPMEQYSVDLNTCQPSPAVAVLTSECLSVCEPVHRAQQTCEQGVSCTCDIASPEIISTCLECQYTAYQGSGVTPASRRALSAYAELCGSSPSSSPSVSTASPDDAPLADPSSSTLPEKREHITGSPLACEYGVPVVTARLPPGFAPMHADRRVLGFVLLALAIVVCVIDRTRHKATA